jgi:hypothetical protein
MKKLLLPILLALVASAHSYEIETFDAPKSFFSEPTVTIRFAQPNANRVVIFLPGGTGNFAIPKEQGAPRGFGIVLNSISESLGADVVVVNNPYPLNDSPGTWYPAMRDTNDHLTRIETIVRHYQRTHDVWLMGHSNGTFSITAFMRRLERQKNTNLVKGIILSGTRDVAQFDRSPETRTLFVHHVKDACRVTSFAEAQRNFIRIQQINSYKTEFVAINSEGASTGDPCHSGYHMMQGAHKETANAIVNFIKESS